MAGETTSAFEALCEKQSSVYAEWNDSDCSWMVWTDAHRRTKDDCRFCGYGATLDEAVADIKHRDVA